MIRRSLFWRVPIFLARHARIDVRVVDGQGDTELGGEEAVESVEGVEDSFAHFSFGGGGEVLLVSFGAAMEAVFVC